MRQKKGNRRRKNNFLGFGSAKELSRDPGSTRDSSFLFEDEGKKNSRSFLAGLFTDKWQGQ